MLRPNLPGHRQVHVLKLDIEGGELHALHGALAMLKASLPDVIMEINEQLIAAAGIARRELFALMKSCGYAGAAPLSGMSELDWYFTPSEPRLRSMRARVEASAHELGFCGPRKCSAFLEAVLREAQEDWGEPLG